ncbi:unnamed protein product [Phytophthora fragariaefolia]|uniref:Unnamed protein product n=1 Tax=Phytophthora fragariaefolia TaxID=1490495 RepID=A0A9W6Y0J5_9STRA|nr:unnamed protein product [Phytophthora fragariaefolia]
MSQGLNLDFGRIMAESSFFLCPSSMEGYGHYINQARSSGGVIITTDAHPMNELIPAPEGGIFVKTKRSTHPHMILGGGFEGEHGLRGFENDGLVAGTNSEDICSAVDAVLDMSVTAREKMAARAQLQYHEDTKVFARQMRELRAYARNQVKLNMTDALAGVLGATENKHSQLRHGEEDRHQRTRQRPKHELEHLRAKVAELQEQLATLSAPDQLTTPKGFSSWKGIAQRQRQEAGDAVGENRRLRNRLLGQLHVARVLEAAIEQHQKEAAPWHALSSTRGGATPSAAARTHEAIFAQLDTSAEAQFAQVNRVLTASGLSKVFHTLAGGFEFQREPNGISFRNEEARLLPFSLQAWHDALWDSLHSGLVTRDTEAQILNKDHSNLIFRDTLDLPDKSHPVRITKRATFRRRIEQDSVVFVWTSDVEIDGSVSVRLREKGWSTSSTFEFYRGVAQGATSSGNVTKGCMTRMAIQLTPEVSEFKSQEEAQLHIGEVTDLIVSTYRHNFGLVHEVVEKVLLSNASTIAEESSGYGRTIMRGTAVAVLPSHLVNQDSELDLCVSKNGISGKRLVQTKPRFSRSAMAFFVFVALGITTLVTEMKFLPRWASFDPSCSPATLDVSNVNYRSDHRFYAMIKGMATIHPPTFRGEHEALCTDDHADVRKFEYCLPITSQDDPVLCADADRIDLLVQQSPSTLCRASVMHLLVSDAFEELKVAGLNPVVNTSSRNEGRSAAGKLTGLSKNWNMCVAPTHPLASYLYDPGCKVSASGSFVPHVALVIASTEESNMHVPVPEMVKPNSNLNDSCSPDMVNAKEVEYDPSNRFHAILQEMGALPIPAFYGPHKALCSDIGRRNRGYRYCLPITGRKDTNFCTGADRMDLLVHQSSSTRCYASVLHMLLADVYHELKVTGSNPIITFGTLLGAIRNGSMIPFTEDADIAYAGTITSGGALDDALSKKGYHLFDFGIWRVCVSPTHPLADHLYDPDAPSAEDNETPYVDLYGMSQMNYGDSWTMQSFKGSIPGNRVEPFSQVSINGLLFDTVHDPKYFLEREYGNDYLKPKPRRPQDAFPEAGNSENHKTPQVVAGKVSRGSSLSDAILSSLKRLGVVEGPSKVVLSNGRISTGSSLISGVSLSVSVLKLAGGIIAGRKWHRTPWDPTTTTSASQCVHTTFSKLTPNRRISSHSAVTRLKIAIMSQSSAIVLPLTDNYADEVEKKIKFEATTTCRKPFVLTATRLSWSAKTAMAFFVFVALGITTLVAELKFLPRWASFDPSCSPATLDVSNVNYRSDHRFYAMIKGMATIHPPTFRGEHEALCTDDHADVRKFEYCLPITSQDDPVLCADADRIDLLVQQSPSTLCRASVMHLLVSDVFEELEAVDASPSMNLTSMRDADQDASAGITSISYTGSVSLLDGFDVALKLKGYHVFSSDNEWHVCVAPTHPLALHLYDSDRKISAAARLVPHVNLVLSLAQEEFSTGATEPNVARAHAHLDDICAPTVLDAKSIEYRSTQRFYTMLKTMEALPAPVFQGEHKKLCNETIREDRDIAYCLPMSTRNDEKFCAGADRIDLLVHQSPSTPCLASVLHMLAADIFEELQATGVSPIVKLAGENSPESLIENYSIIHSGEMASGSSLDDSLLGKGYNLYYEGDWRVCVAPTHPLADNLYNPGQPIAGKYAGPYIKLIPSQQEQVTAELEPVETDPPITEETGIELHTDGEKEPQASNVSEVKSVETEAPITQADTETQSIPTEAVVPKIPKAGCTPSIVQVLDNGSGDKFYSALNSSGTLPAPHFNGEHEVLCNAINREVRKFRYCLPISGRKDTPFCANADRMDILSRQSPGKFCFASVLHMLLADVYRELEEIGAAPLLTYGTLLGAVRDGGIIPFTEDVDIAYRGNIINGGELDERLWRKGYHLFDFNIWRVCVAPTHPLASQLYDPNHPIVQDYTVPYVDLYAMEQRFGSLWSMQELQVQRLSSERVEPFAKVFINDVSYNTVHDPNFLLLSEYGRDYMTPKPRERRLQFVGDL